MPVTYPGGGPRITVEALLKQPRLIARALTDLTSKRFVADRVLARGSAEQVASGVALYQKSESIYMDRDPGGPMAERTEFPRAGWSEALFAAAVKKYGLEVPITDNQKRRNALDTVARGQRKLANSLVKFVDKLVMDMLIADTDVLTAGAGAHWHDDTTGAVITNLATARNAIETQDEGYEPDTLIINPAQELDLLTNSKIRDALPRETGQSAIATGRVIPILGFRQVLVTSQLTKGTVFVVSSNIIGTIADEAPGADENYTSYNPGDGKAPVYVKMYREENHDETIVRAARFPAMWLSEPKSAYKITAADA